MERRLLKKRNRHDGTCVGRAMEQSRLCNTASSVGTDEFDQTQDSDKTEIKRYAHVRVKA